MSYRVELHPLAKAKINSWDLTGRFDYLLVDIELRLRTLRDNPASVLRRVEQPFDGMVLEFSVIDPNDRMCEHRFAFLVLYRQDEETLTVANAGYMKQVGM
ncbi:MAG: hypothetical protein K2R98_19795 [Gemmataceae bacterium]|nr:hypothetical protein [Gemmataceae bacterium]